MALLSRSSLRGSVRRAEEPADGLTPAKKQRIEEPGPDQRKSSPDCLDTPAEDPPTAKLRSNPLKPSRPRTATRRTRGGSASSIDTVASAGQLTTPATRKTTNGTFKTPRARRDQSNPSATADVLRGIHESPDPLDTISPAPPSGAQRQRNRTPAAIAEANSKSPPSPGTRPTRRNETRSLADRDDKKVIKKETAVEDATATRNSKSDVPSGEQPAQVEKRTGRRSLRSADTGSRCKSELAQYFHNYEQIISLEEPEPECLAANTTITLVDDLPQPFPSSSTPDPTPFGNPLLNLHDCERITLPETRADSSGIDPLSEEIYFRAHRKFERQEKQLRNIERNRAQHEQQALERLLEELRGHDWLRMMGLTGVHESDKKLYEPKRDILIQELVALVNKFQAWKDEERRRKLEKDKPLPTSVDSESRRHSRKRSRPAEEIGSSPAPGSELQQTTPDPDPSDVDAWAARQLHQEARSASAAKARKTAPPARKPTSKPTPNNHITATKSKESASASKSSPTRKKPDHPPAKSTPSTSAPTPAPKKNLQQASLSHFWNPAPRDGPFTSFFRQRHVRQAAIAATNGVRRSGSRSALAFGHPVPDPEEQEFELPPDILNEEAIQQSQRKRRRLKRGSQG